MQKFNREKTRAARTLATLALAAGLAAGATACTVEEPPAPPVSEQPAERTEPTPEEAEPSFTTEEEQAIDSARSYLDLMAFSRSGLVEQLVFEGFPEDTAAWAVDQVGPDWNAEAAESAVSYLDTMAFSREGLLEQLEFEGFTPEQAEHGVTAAGL